MNGLTPVGVDEWVHTRGHQFGIFGSQKLGGQKTFTIAPDRASPRGWDFLGARNGAAPPKHKFMRTGAEDLITMTPTRQFRVSPLVTGVMEYLKKEASDVPVTYVGTLCQYRALTHPFRDVPEAIASTMLDTYIGESSYLKLKVILKNVNTIFVSQHD
jgi:hypothetical protein